MATLLKQWGCLLTHLLIDADILVFRFASAFSKDEEIDWGGGLKSNVDNYELATAQIDRFTKFLMSKTFSTKATMCFTSKVNFRYGVLPTYKHNRTGMKKPRLMKSLVQYLKSNYPFKEKHGLEADYIMGIMATNETDSCIATIDKDLLQIPGRHYNWNHGWMCHVEKEDADNFFWQQCLSGDPGDGYHGIPGVGAKTAETILSNIKDDDNIWDVIVQEYVKKGLTEEKALQQARVARICRAENYNYDKGEVILWEP